MTATPDLPPEGLPQSVHVAASGGGVLDTTAKTQVHRDLLRKGEAKTEKKEQDLHLQNYLTERLSQKVGVSLDLKSFAEK